MAGPLNDDTAIHHPHRIHIIITNPFELLCTRCDLTVLLSDENFVIIFHLTVCVPALHLEVKVNCICVVNKTLRV